jgi:UDP-N-acetylmuramoyl-L-alanyl-D-glutamate--2,6-diaminopimelate ligase
MSMDLGELLEAVETIPVRVLGLDGGTGGGPGGPQLPEVTAVVHDTAAVVPGAVFCCVRGSRVDGHDLAPKAVAGGAAAVVVDHLLDPLVQPTGAPVPQLVVPDVRSAMGPVAAAFWGHPSRSLTVLGVTGTAGKTTVIHLLQAVMTSAGRPCGLVGTLSGERTTPEATELQELLAAELAAGRQAVAIEVSSHGLELHRVDGTHCAVAIFTNLSRDHLDFHRTMDAYFAAKARLFTPELTHHAVICADDPWGQQLLDLVDRRQGVEAFPYSRRDASDLQLHPGGIRFTWQGQDVALRLPGRFNLDNALAAATAGLVVGLDPADIAAGLAASPPVPGRFEPIDAGQPFTVLVDYSHKPDALAKALQASRELAAAGSAGGPLGRVVVVFGCGGDRDASKRPLMGSVAAELADRVVVTSDNPRSEQPVAIIDQILAGIGAEARQAGKVVVEPDRRQAIGLAVEAARSGDVVLVAGKGHEQTQTVGDQVLAFDDRVVARTALAEAGWR